MELRQYYLYRRWIGVNFGGFLVLERWITPSLFEGLDDIFEGEMGFWEGHKNEIEKGTKKILDHWKTFIVEEDLKVIFFQII